jgi:hypothetical protein
MSFYLSILIVFSGVEDQTKSLTYARQELYHYSIPSLTSLDSVKSYSIIST